MAKPGKPLKVKSGQRWMKKDTKVCLTIISKQPGDTFRVSFDRRTIKSSHKMKEHDILKFYVKV